eukprot:4275558-Pyramimonas_sp.AAC.1
MHASAPRFLACNSWLKDHPWSCHFLRSSRSRGGAGQEVGLGTLAGRCCAMSMETSWASTSLSRRATRRSAPIARGATSST